MRESCMKPVGYLPNVIHKSHRSSLVKRNIFAISNMLSIGGGELDGLAEMMKYRRFGGGVIDTCNYLNKYKVEKTEFKSCKADLELLAQYIGIEAHSIKPYSLRNVRDLVSTNYDANPGPSYTALGFRNKHEAFETAFDVAARIQSRVINNQNDNVILFGLAGRSKLALISEICAKLIDGESVGRGVWMADAHESPLSSRFTAPLLERFKLGVVGILLGYNKFSSQSIQLHGKLIKFNLFIEYDFKKFDSSLKRVLIHLSFDYVRYIMDLSNSDKLVLKYLEDQFIYSHIVRQDGYVFRKNTGNPSGSNWVSIINTLVNIFVVLKTLSLYNILKDFYVVCYGDDGILALNVDLEERERFKYGKALLSFMMKYLKDTFDMTMSENDSKVFTQLNVSYASPKIPYRIEGSSRSVIKKLKMEQIRNGTYKSGFWNNHIRLDTEPEAEYVGGNTHRWSYRFAESPKILSYYFNERGKMIRPTFEVINRLVNTQREVKTLDQHEEMLLCALMENLENKHTVNHIMHYLLDCVYMRRMGLTTSKAVRKDVSKEWDYAFFKKKREGEASIKKMAEVMDIRAWYRKIDKVVDLAVDKRTKWFVFKFTKMINKMRKTFDSDINETFMIQKIKRLGVTRDLTSRQKVPFLNVREIGVYQAYLSFLNILRGEDGLSGYPKYMTRIKPQVKVNEKAVKALMSNLFIKRFPRKFNLDCRLRGGTANSSSSVYLYVEKIKQTTKRRMSYFQVCILLFKVWVEHRVRISLFSIKYEIDIILIFVKTWFCRNFCTYTETVDSYVLDNPSLLGICLKYCPAPRKKWSPPGVTFSELQDIMTDI